MLHDHAIENTVTPLDEPVTQSVLIPFGLERAPATDAGTPHRVLSWNTGGSSPHIEAASGFEGMVVDVEIPDWPTPSRAARGSVIEILGRQDEFSVDVEVVIRKHHVPHVFPRNVSKRRALPPDWMWRKPRAAAISTRCPSLPSTAKPRRTRRRRLRPAAPRRKMQGAGPRRRCRWICDHPGTRSISERGCTAPLSIFLIVPCLCFRRSFQRCLQIATGGRSAHHLLHHDDRSDGEIRGFEMTQGIIRSVSRMAYTQVRPVLDDDRKDREQCSAGNRLRTDVELARLLNQKRQRHGPIDFDLPEPVIDSIPRELSERRSLRAKLGQSSDSGVMLSANQCVASWLRILGVPSFFVFTKSETSSRG